MGKQQLKEITSPREAEPGMEPGGLVATSWLQGPALGFSLRGAEDGSRSLGAGQPL